MPARSRGVHKFEAQLADLEKDPDMPLPLDRNPAQRKFHYYSLHVPVPEKVLLWMEKQLEENTSLLHTSSGDSHITLVHGIDPSDYLSVHWRVMMEQPTTDDISFGEPYFVQPAHSPSISYFCIEVFSE